MMRIIAIISGSRMVGKTTVAAGLARVMQQRGRNLCLLTQTLSPFSDSLGPDSAVVWELKQVISSRQGLNAVLRKDPSGIAILPLGCDESPGELNKEQADAFYGSLSALEPYDTLILDVNGGLSRQALAFCLCATETVVLITPETSVLADTLELLKALAINGFHDSLKLVVNQAKNAKTAREAFAGLLEPVMRRMHIALDYLGSISYDEHLAKNGMKVHTFFQSRCPAASDLEQIGEKLLAESAPIQALAHPASFWEQLMSLLVHPLKLPERSQDQPVCKAPGPAKQGPAPQPPATAEWGHAAAADIVAALNAIGQRIADMASELSAIRRLLENERRLQPVAQSSEVPDTEDRPEIITLDFDSFIAQHKDKLPNPPPDGEMGK
jgi:MinD-like ATPase involved in chromosome partitioning or flagellar assembly